MKESDLLSSMSHWSPEQLLAVHDFCQMVSDTIWKHHADPLLEHLNGDVVVRGTQSLPASVEDTLPLPFDDELNF